MKPTIIRNRTIYQASPFLRSKSMCSHLSDELTKKYHKRSIRVTEGDTVKVMRGEFKGVSGKITRVSTEKNGVSIEGIKKEKLKGGNLDVFIHTSNLLVTEITTDDKWRQNKLEGKKPAKEAKPAAEKPAEKKEAKPAKDEKPKPTKESKAAKPAKKESK